MDRYGIGEVMRRAVDIAVRGTGGIYVSLDLVEVNPILDRSNASADLAVELALSALGKRVWGQV